MTVQKVKIKTTHFNTVNHILRSAIHHIVLPSLPCNTSDLLYPRHPRTKMEQKYPLLPPLYFQDRGADQLLPVPTALLASITNFLDWHDFMRMAQVNTSFRDMVKDSTLYGGTEAKWSLAIFLLNRDGQCHPDTKANLAIQILTELASLSDNPLPKAIRQLALCYNTGMGVVQDASMGLKWLETAHIHGDSEAAYDIAKIHESGLYNAPVDIVKAAEWFEIAAQAGHVEAMVEYALCLELGCGVDPSEEEALDWYTKAAELGHATANYSVGEMFEEARAGLPQSDTEAVLWYWRAAVNGDHDSLRALERLSDVARIVIPGWGRAFPLAV